MARSTASAARIGSHSGGSRSFFGMVSFTRRPASTGAARGFRMVSVSRQRWMQAGAVLAVLFLAGAAAAHGVAADDRAYIEQTSGPQIGAFLYLGAKHMVTGYDHLLFLTGVIFFLYRLKQVATYVTLFAIGHSTTLLAGVLLGTNVSSHLVDTIIGLSVVYKALDNIQAYQRWFGFQPNTKAAVLFFGFFHGFGLATKLQQFSLSKDG